MKDLGALNILRIPLQVLWEFPNIGTKIERESPELEEEFTRWLGRYEPGVQQHMLAQLDWAVANPTYDFQSILKNVKTPNEEILAYFSFLKNVFLKAGVSAAA